MNSNKPNLNQDKDKVPEVAESDPVKKPYQPGKEFGVQDKPIPAQGQDLKHGQELEMDEERPQGREGRTGQRTGQGERPKKTGTGEEE